MDYFVQLLKNHSENLNFSEVTDYQTKASDIFFLKTLSTKDRCCFF
jgi:hypothetical protein